MTYDELLTHCNLLVIALRCLPREDPDYPLLQRDYDETRRELSAALADPMSR
jgi:hypothetical protein